MPKYSQVRQQAYLLLVRRKKPDFGKSAHPKSVSREAAPWKPNTPVVPSPKITMRDIQEIPRRYSKHKRQTPRRLISE